MGVNYYLKDATYAVDQSQTTNDANVVVGQTENKYQSFTTGASVVTLGRVMVHMNNGSGETITIRIREGEGTGGTLLGTASKTFTSGPDIDVDFEFDHVVPLLASTQYSFTIDSSGDFATAYENSAGGYAGGRNDQGAGRDYHFKTYETTGRGAIDTSAGTNSKKVGISLSATQLLLLNT